MAEIAALTAIAPAQTVTAEANPAKYATGAAV